MFIILIFIFGSPAVYPETLEKVSGSITGDLCLSRWTYYIKFNTPIIIYYDEKAFRISGNNYVNQYECTWKCQNLRKKIKNNNTIICILIILIIKVNIPI